MSGFHHRLFAEIAEGTLVLTANRRLSRHLRRRYDVEMAGQGRPVWNSPAVTGIGDWLKTLLAVSGDDDRLLERFAAQRLWETIIDEESSGAGRDLLQVPATARRAMEAHQLLSDYRVEPPEEDLTGDQEIFLGWRRAFLAACRSGGWLEPGTLVAAVTQKVSAGGIDLPRRILLTGFDEITPAIRSLCDILTERGVAVEENPPPLTPSGEIVRIACADTADEVRTSARWARRLLEQGEENIGVVVPRLSECRPLFERIYREEIDPASLLSADSEEEAFGLSLGVPLADQGAIVAALDLLSLEDEIPLRTASRLLRSPHLGGSGSEESARALLDGRLRSFGDERVRLPRLAALARRDGAERAPRFARICEHLTAYLQDRRRRTAGEWVERFVDLLKGVGWPGDRSPDSREYQVLGAWRDKVLPAMIGLDRVTPPLGRGAAVSLLRRVAAETEFHPETPESPIQVVGHLEASGLAFDHLWVLGLAEDVLPAPAAPNPFLPLRLQSSCGMPHADGKREMHYARKLAGRLFASAPRVVASHPKRRGDSDLRPSPLISGVGEGEVALAPSSAPLLRVAGEKPPLQVLSDEAAPPFGRLTSAEGGTAVLKDQALCPFRAFVRHRLFGRALESPGPGIDSRVRGSLLHAALESFWRRIRSHRALLAMEEPVFRETVREVVTEAVAFASEEGAVSAPDAVLEIERDRLEALVREWLEMEKERSPFVVLETEREHVERLGELSIKTKVDRVDRVGEGFVAVIDYKTGRVDLGDLLGDRLIEPQLPIYGVGANLSSLGGVAFGIVRPGECTLKGICREDSILPKSGAFSESKAARSLGIEGWEGLLDRWQRQLADLGEEFLDGRAAVEPVDPEKACRFCDLSSLCRIDEIALEEEWG